MEASMSAPARQIHTSTSFNAAAPFLRRTHNLLTDSSTDAIICWAKDGKSFTVKAPHLLTTILPKRAGIFKESYGGFVRELALYGFRCTESDANGIPVTFTVENFEKGKFELIGSVKRKGNYGRSRRM